MKSQIKSFIIQDRIKSIINIVQFLNSIIEQINDIDENIVKAITETYDHDERAYEIDEKNVSKPHIKINEIIQLLKRLQLYKKQQKNNDDMMITRLRKYGKDIRAKRAFKQ